MIDHTYTLHIDLLNVSINQWISIAPINFRIYWQIFFFYKYIQSLSVKSNKKKYLLFQLSLYRKK